MAADDDDPLLSIRARRRVLVALGYGAANVALTGVVGWSDRARPGTGGLIDLTSGLGRPPVLEGAPDQPPPGHRYDLVVVGGRVIDPDSGFDGVANVGVDGEMVTALTTDPLEGDTVIDARDLVVAPGFIDLLSFEPNSFGVWNKLADGVTTNLAMHGVSNYAAAFFDRYEGETPIHFGGAFHQHFMRAEEIGAGVEDELTRAQQRRFEAVLAENLEAGFAGVCCSPEYAPGTTRDEMVGLAEVAVEAGHMSFFHTRYSDPDPPGTGRDGLREVLAVARATGSPVHVEHITSTGGTFEMGPALELLEEARSDGVDVTACCYPYDSWGTFLASSRFALGWRQRYRIDDSDLQVAGTEQRLSPVTFDQAQADNKLVVALGAIPEQELHMVLQRPWTMVSSDAILNPDLNNHPRASGTFSRLLGRYVREQGVLGLPDALAKITILPARRVEAMLPDLARKGRLQRGADADVVVFDPATVVDRATVASPELASVGVRFVLVEGTVALSDGEPRRDTRAGRALRSVVR
ncbi:MAG: amidohydrolase family protein [Acidimicrobiales bacterium]